jgi:xanthine/uracil permease
MNITIKLIKIVMLMANAKNKGKKGRIVLLIGLIIIISSGIFLYLLGWYGWFLIGPLIMGVILFVIGLGLLLDYYYKAREEKPSKPSKPSRWKQAEPIT